MKDSLSDSLELEGSPRVCIPNKLPFDTSAAHSQFILCTLRVERFRVQYVSNEIHPGKGTDEEGDGRSGDSVNSKS